MMHEIMSLIDQVHARRMRELLLDFASIEDPPYDTAISAEWYAGCLRAAGAAEVRILRDHPRTPTVIAG
ncbi:MAG TPA: hypothetical protein VHB98_13920, partial [Chloroflexota bacterium]|nr:hypothetical protein [Chloroflexota bacterium]